MRPMFAAILFVLGMAVPLSAQTRPAPVTFASARVFACSFTVYAAAVWNDGQPSVLSNPQEFAFQVDELDRRRGRARVVGTAASSPATLMVSEAGLNVIEPTATGNLNLTTIFSASADGKYLAVHSRHLGDVSGPPRVSQTYGTCEAKP